MNITRSFWSGSALLCAAAILLTPAWGAPKEPASRAVEKAVKTRAGLELRWQESAAARAEVQQQVRALLQKPLTVNRAVQIAVLNNRELLATLEDIGVSAADLREAGMWKNPSIDLSVRFPDRPPSGANWEEAAAFDLLDLLMIPLRKRVAAEQLETTQLRVTDEVLKLVGEVKTAVYEALADGAIIGQRQKIVEIERTALDLAQRQHEAGNITDLALNQQQATYSQARLELAATETESHEHRETINRLLSLWGAETNWKIGSELPAIPEKEVPLRGLESLAVTQRFDLAAAHRELSSTVHALGLTKAYRYVGALEFGVDTERESDRTNYTGPTLRLELPLFNQGQARMAKGEAELRRAERKLEALAIGLRAEVRSLHDKLSASRDAALFYRDEILPNRRAITAGMLLQYNGMLAGNYELFAVRAEEFEAEIKGLEAQRAYWTTRAALERAVGGNLSGRTKNKP